MITEYHGLTGPFTLCSQIPTLQMENFCLERERPLLKKAQGQAEWLFLFFLNHTTVVLYDDNSEFGSLSYWNYFMPTCLSFMVLSLKYVLET
jgi:hypothetical protein